MASKCRFEIHFDEERVLQDRKDIQKMWRKIDEILEYCQVYSIVKLSSPAPGVYECFDESIIIKTLDQLQNELEFRDWFMKYCTSWIYTSLDNKQFDVLRYLKYGKRIDVTSEIEIVYSGEDDIDLD